MSNKSYQAECIECHKHFIAKKVRTRFCSNICRAKYSRDNRLKLIESQNETIKTQEKIIATVMPDPGPAHDDQEKVQSISIKQWDSVLHEFNTMVADCKRRAYNDGKTEHFWSSYVKEDEDRRFQEIWPIIHSVCYGRIKVLRYRSL